MLCERRRKFGTLTDDKGVRIDKDQGNSWSRVEKASMRSLWSILLVFVLTAGGGIFADGPSGASTAVPMVHHSVVTHASAAPIDHCNAPASDEQDARHKGCCQGVTCAPGGIVALIPFTIPIRPRNSGQVAIAAYRIIGRSVLPETGPPRPFA
jgi:hypothetical protein